LGKIWTYSNEVNTTEKKNPNVIYMKKLVKAIITNISSLLNSSE